MSKLTRSPSISVERRAKRYRRDTSNPLLECSMSAQSTSSSESDEQAATDTDDTFFAFHSALLADIASGKSITQAVEALFDDMNDESVRSGTRTSIGQLNLAAPVLSALSVSPQLAEDLDTVARMCQTVYELVEDEIDMLRSGRKRLDLRLSHIYDVSKLIGNANNIVVLSGAGVSVSCGIPDFRSKGGLYDTVLERFGLSDPQAIFDLEEFKLDPKLFYSFAKEVMPSKDLEPSATHNFIAELESKGKLLRNYSQNIDGLERRAGVSEDRVILCHGSFLTATCMRKSCGAKIAGCEIANEVSAGTVPICRKCGSERDENEDMGVLKPDIVFFGESLPRKVSENLERDIARADLVLVLGTSLQVAPVAKIPQYFGESVPRILVNRELIGYEFDVELLGDCDVVVSELRNALGWGLERKEGEECEIRFRPPRQFVFPGAKEHRREEGESSGKTSTLLC